MGRVLVKPKQTTLDRYFDCETTKFPKERCELGGRLDMVNPVKINPHFHLVIQLDDVRKKDVNQHRAVLNMKPSKVLNGGVSIPGANTTLKDLNHLGSCSKYQPTLARLPKHIPKWHHARPVFRGTLNTKDKTAVVRIRSNVVEGQLLIHCCLVLAFLLMFSRDNNCWKRLINKIKINLALQTHLLLNLF